MTFPYPLTPEVRADLWRFYGCDDEEADGLDHHLPELPYGTTSADGHLLDTPFARAFVAWREGLCAEMKRLVDVAAGLAMYQSLWAEEQDDRRELVRRVMRLERERVAKMFGSEWSPPFTEDDVDAVLARAATVPR